MQPTQEIHSLLLVLKRRLKAHGYTYAQLGAALGVAEISVKRFFRGEPAALKHLPAVCDFLQVSLFDAAAAAASLREQESYFTAEQDAYFARDLAAYAIFIELFRRLPAGEVCERWKLSEAAFFRTLRSFEKLGLIELLPENRYRFRLSGPVKAPPGGALQKVLFAQNLDFLAYAQGKSANPAVLTQTSEVLVSDGLLREMREEFTELSRRWRSKVYREQVTVSPAERRSIRWTFALAPFATDWRHESRKAKLPTSRVPRK